MDTASKINKKLKNSSLFYKKSFRGEIFFYFIIVFIIFSIAILTFQYQREKKYRTDQLEISLDNITEITNHYINENQLTTRSDFSNIDEINKIIPLPNIRITIISPNGDIFYDSSVNNISKIENHSNRPEIIKAKKKQKGTDIRFSDTTHKEYYYYAKKYDDYFIRTAVIYNVQIENFLKAERAFIIFIIISFSIIGIMLYFVTGKLSDAITKLKNFAIKAGNNELIEPDTTFPENELGIIGSQIIEIYHKLKKAKDELFYEKEKLFNHLNALNEGIAFFSSTKKCTLSNHHFIQNMNIISKKSISQPNKIFRIGKFKKLNNFLEKIVSSDEKIKSKKLPQIEYIISKGEKYFKIKSIVFLDKSFEVIITDITRLEKRRLMKQQLTSNIAHELKTPLASIKGYLETILNNWPVPDEKQKYFLKKTYLQAERLTYLINDVSLLNNIEDAGDLFYFKEVDIKNIIDDVYENFENRMQEKGIQFFSNVSNGTTIEGNDSLLFSIFQNFIENSINYGGEKISITIKIYHEDARYYYFSYSDTGEGIPEKHLPRIFERFYRVEQGRTRETGGTGLGLAIVKNAIILHKGEISVRNKPKGGIEFLFSLAKK